VSIRTGSTSGTIVATSSTVTINDTSLTYIPPTQRAIFGYGSTGDGVSMTNLVSDTGVVATDTTGVGTGRMELAAASYGGDKAIFGYGGNNSSYNQSRTNLVSNTGVVATDTTGVGTARRALAAAGYGGNKAIFGYGASVSVTAITNKVSSTGVVATDTAGVGTARQYLAAAGYGGDKAIFGYGWDGTHYSMTNLVTNTGVVGNDVTGVGTVRKAHGAAGYGGDKAIFGFGQTPGGGDYVYATNLVSNTGVVASDVTFVYYTGPGQTRTARGNYAAASYGGDKAIFGYGFNTSVTNLISNTGVLGIDRTGVGTARFGLAAAGSSRYTDIFLSGNVNIGSTSLTSTNAVAPRVTVITYPGNDTAANPAGGQTIILNGSGFQSGATVLVSGTIVDVVSFVSNIQLTFVSPAMDAGSYVLYVINPDGGTATSIPGIQYSGVPTWTTTAGSLGSSMESSAVTYTITATGDAPVTYSVFSGSLPAGLSLNSSTGVISGTTPAVESDTTYNFTIRATDAQNQDTDRAFSLTILAVTYTITPASSSVNEGSTLTFNVGGTGITNGTYYYTINNTTTAAADFSGSVTSGSFTITSNVGSFT